MNDTWLSSLFKYKLYTRAYFQTIHLIKPLIFPEKVECTTFFILSQKKMLQVIIEYATFLIFLMWNWMTIFHFSFYLIFI